MGIQNPLGDDRHPRHWFRPVERWVRERTLARVVRPLGHMNVADKYSLAIRELKDKVMSNIEKILLVSTEKNIALQAEIERLREELAGVKDDALRLHRDKMDLWTKNIEQRAAIIEECAMAIEQWENDDTPRSYKDLIDAIRKLKQ